MGFVDYGKLDLLSSLKQGSYPFERANLLGNALRDCATDYFAKSALSRPFEARGMLVTAQSRVGKSHELGKLVQKFNSENYPLPSGMPARILSLSLWEDMTWKDLSRSTLAELGYPTGGRATGTEIWRRTLDQAKRVGVIGIWYDEAQHAFSHTGDTRNRSVLDSFKAILKDRNWPMMLILSGVPELATHIEQDLKSEERRQLRHLLTPVHMKLIELPGDLAELQGILFSYAKRGEVDVRQLNNQDFFERLSYICGYRWGLVIELLIEAIVLCVSSEDKALSLQHFAEIFALRSGTNPRSSPFLIEEYQSVFDPNRTCELLNRAR